MFFIKIKLWYYNFRKEYGNLVIGKK